MLRFLVNVLFGAKGFGVGGVYLYVEFIDP